ncbi:MAG: dTDP-4-dehydrorhamnose 3,5-epimerase [Spirochaetales bacterium]
MPASFTPGPLAGLVIIQPRVFPDGRGSFFETYKQTEYASNGVADAFVQDNHSVSTQGVLRGLHFQNPPFVQGKLVRVIQGCVWDVAVDLRPESPTFGRWFGLELSAENRTQFYIPAGFGHGFVTLSETAEFVYKCTAEYNKASEGGVRWDDPTLGIAWPLAGLEVSVSDKEAALPFLERPELKGAH